MGGVHEDERKQAIPCSDEKICAKPKDPAKVTSEVCGLPAPLDHGEPANIEIVVEAVPAKKVNPGPQHQAGPEAGDKKKKKQAPKKTDGAKKTGKPTVEGYGGAAPSAQEKPARKKNNHDPAAEQASCSKNEKPPKRAGVD